ncbi:MAG: serine/threonine protein kinase [Candidatus Methylacidiphilales bacterium]
MTIDNPDAEADPPEIFSWGHQPTRLFFSLTPDVIFDAVEKLGHRCTGRCLPLNSLENRVLEVGVDAPEPVLSESEKFRVAKFYRPQRWTAEQIQEEHVFLQDLRHHDVPVVVPESDSSGRTLFSIGHQEIFFCVFPKFGGRNPDELSREQLEWLGRSLARLHHVGALSNAPHRMALTPDSYGLAALDFLLDAEVVPENLEDPLIDVVEDLCEQSAPWFSRFPAQRVHGDCHLGNILWSATGPVFVDFDDMVNASTIQDIWLLTPGRDSDGLAQREVLLEAYESLNAFDRHSLALVEPLRALRYIHFAAWIAKRWIDPAFPRAFPEFEREAYWNELIQDLEECLELIPPA